MGAVKATQDTDGLGVPHQLSGCLNEVVFIRFHKIPYCPNLVTLKDKFGGFDPAHLFLSIC